MSSRPNRTKLPPRQSAPTNVVTRTGNRAPGVAGQKQKRPASSSSEETAQSSSSATKVGERGLKPAAPPFNNAVQGEKNNGKGIIAVREWLEQLHKQAENGKYDLEDFTGLPGESDIEMGKCARVLKEICSKLKSRTNDHSKQSAALHSQVETLCEKLQSACKAMYNEKSESRVTGKGKAADKGLSYHLATADKNVDLLIHTLGETSRQLTALQSQANTLCGKLQSTCNEVCKEASESRVKKKGKTLDQGSKDQFTTADQNVNMLNGEIEKRSRQLASLQSQADTLCEKLQKACNEVCKEASESRVKGKGKALDQGWKDQFTTADQNVNMLTDKMEKRSQQLAALQSQADTLCETLQSACNEVFKEPKGKGKGKAVDQGLKDQFTTADQNVNLLTGEIEKRRETKAINEKLNDKRIQEITDKAEQSAKLKITAVTDWLGKLKTQIEKDKYDVTVFAKIKDMDGSHDEINKCNTAVADICRKLNIQSEDKKRVDAELKLLTNEINEWNNVNTIKSAKDLSDEMAKIVRTMRLHVSEKKKEFSSAEAELKLLANEIKAWTDVKTVENGNELPDGMTKLVRTTRLQLFERKEKNISEKTPMKEVTMELSKQEHDIKKIWKYIFPDKKESETVSANNALDDLGKYIAAMKGKLEKLTILRDEMETEVLKLQEEVQTFKEVPKSCPKNVDESSAEILHTIRKARIQLYEKKKEINEDLQTSAENKKQQGTRLRQHAVTLWEMALGTEMDMTKFENVDAGIKNGVVQLLEEVTSEFKKLEDVSFKLEGAGHTIYEDLIGEKPPVTDTDQLKTSANVLQNTVQILQRCQKDTGMFVKNLSELEAVLVPDCKHKSISEKCKAMTQTARGWQNEYEEMKSILNRSLQALSLSYSELTSEPYEFSEPYVNMESIRKRVPDWFQDVAVAISRIRGCTKENKESFQKKFIKMEIHEKLKEKQNKLLVEMDELKAKNDDTLNRLSKVAGARLTDNNPNIADLSDPNRPTRLAEQYSELYDTPWTDAYETLKVDEKDRINFLLEILVECYKISGDISGNHQKILKRVICNPTEGIGPERKATKKDKENTSTLSAVQSKALSELRKQSADLSVISVKAHIQTENQEWFKTKKLQTYTFLCIELCWLMHVQSPPVFLETSIKAGSPFDTSKYKQYTKAGKKIDYLVWPALFLQEGGAMLSKGVAQGK